MATRPISITGSNTSTGELDLDFPNLEAFSGDTILWKIHPKSGVDSIEIIREKTGSDDIWSTRPQNGNHWNGKIKDGVRATMNIIMRLPGRKTTNFIYTMLLFPLIRPYKHSTKI